MPCNLKESARPGLDQYYVGVLPTCTKRWYRLDGRLGWSCPSSLTAWSRKYLPDGSSKSSISAGLDKPDDGRARRTGWQLPGGHVRAARRPGGPSSPATRHVATGPRVEVEAIVAGRRCRVVVLLMFFAAWAGLVVRVYVTRRQDH
jgi:hypothetical protein